MKIREGFVSNSSSSSFIMMSKKAITKKHLLSIFDEHPEIFNDFVEKMKNRIIERILKSAQTLESYYQEKSWDDHTVVRARNNGYKYIAKTWFPDWGESGDSHIDEALCNAWACKFENEDFFLEKEDSH